MTILSSHQYYLNGLKLGKSNARLEELMNYAFKFEKHGIPYIHSIEHLAILTGTDPNFIRNIISRRIESYITHCIPKRSGGNRFLHIPIDELKKIQQWVNNNILVNTNSHWCCYSYKKNASIKKCAEKHIDCKWLIKLDIENFFDTVSEVDVYHIFRKLGYKASMAFYLARICTYQSNYYPQKFNRWIRFKNKSNSTPIDSTHVHYFGQLPQGSPTSPILSNLALYGLDHKLNNLIHKMHGIYTRYADDMFISFSIGDFDRTKARTIIGLTSNLIKNNGYNLNKTKIKIIPPGSKKTILGLNVKSNGISLSRTYKNRIEAHLYGIKKFGISAHVRHRGFQSIFGFIEHLKPTFRS